MGNLIWGSILTTTLGFEAWAIKYRPTWTLSDFIRRTLHTNTTIGRIVFLTLWATFAIWFGWHIAFET